MTCVILFEKDTLLVRAVNMGKSGFHRGIPKPVAYCTSVHGESDITSRVDHVGDRDIVCDDM